jgi:hypothetical protein
MCKTSKIQTNFKKKKKPSAYSRVVRAYKPNISGFKFWTKIIVCLNEANWHLCSPENV